MKNTFLKDFIVGELPLQRETKRACSRISAKVALVEFIESNGFELDDKKYKDQEDLRKLYNEAINSKKDFILNFFDNQKMPVKMIYIPNLDDKEDPFLFFVESSKNRITEFSSLDTESKDEKVGAKITSISDTPDGNIYIAELEIPYAQDASKTSPFVPLEPKLEIDLWSEDVYEVVRGVYEGFGGDMVGRKLDDINPEKIHSAVKEITSILKKGSFKKISGETRTYERTKIKGLIDKTDSNLYSHIPYVIVFYNEQLAEFIFETQDVGETQSK